MFGLEKSYALHFLITIMIKTVPQILTIDTYWFTSQCQKAWVKRKVTNYQNALIKATNKKLINVNKSNWQMHNEQHSSHNTLSTLYFNLFYSHFIYSCRSINFLTH